MSRVISGGIVAEKNSVCRVKGTSLKMRSMSGMKPMSSMRSASSTTMICTPVSISLPRSKWSSRRPGRGDQHVDAAVDQLVLVLEADAADQQRHGELHVRRVLLELLGDLRGELAGRGEHQAARHARPGAALGEVRDHRQHEGAGLAGAGLGDAEHVAAFERVRDRLDLDRGGGDVAGFGHGLQDPRVQREIGECGHVACVGSVAAMAAAFLHAARTPGLGSAFRLSYSDASTTSIALQFGSAGGRFAGQESPAHDAAAADRLCSRRAGASASCTPFGNALSPG